ncbi:M15 family metallopeptidase [Actinomadura syzygii]|uniref:D-alanyl-D-alanine dipeptidase n=1 Tax=Actinomadura syzygii TaxID=1427538 RepID=A0A5D0TT37_9ACTN|nr:M15 family metallopeptidase [Actinomadura syzygii]TYC08506.1 M15 family metallopeptidase [Actinomadura syzygii]
MASPSKDDSLLASAEQSLPSTFQPASLPIPALTPESILLRRAVPATDTGEPLTQIRDNGIPVLHNYAQAGWRHAVDQQWLRADALARLRQAAATLPPSFGLAIFDGWRPLALQRELFDAITPNSAPDAEHPVAPPSEDPAEPPPHLTGGAVDLTLTWQGTPLPLGTAFDEFTDQAMTTAFENLPGPVRTLRRLLYHALRRQGFVVLAEEWWHFEFGTRLWSSLTGQPTRYGPATP